MKRFKSIVMAALAVVIAAAYLLPAASADAVSSSSLSITPKKNYVIKPGKSVTDKLMIHNLDHSAPLKLSLRVIDFTYSGKGGTPKLFLGKNNPQTTWSLKPFMSLPKSVTIPPSTSKSVKLKVSIPKGHGAGSYYSAIVYSSGDTSEGGNVGLSASGVTLVFVTIPGKVKEGLSLEKFGAYFPKTPTVEGGYKFITATMPHNIAYTLKNSGNVTESPVGSIKLSDMFGHNYKITNINPSGSLALIGQTRTFVSCIKLASEKVDFHGSRTQANQCVNPGLWPGRYTASLDLYYGQNGNNTKEITGTMTFWYLPIWFVVIVLIILAVIAYYIWKLVRTVKGKPTKKLSRRRR